MAKHDQTILKFLNQHADRAPTLIDMMTKLKINVSDITDSLTDLLAKGVISKQTNDQGMEIWSVATQGKEIKAPEIKPEPPELTSAKASAFVPTSLSTPPSTPPPPPKVDVPTAPIQESTSPIQDSPSTVAEISQPADSAAIPAQPSLSSFPAQPAPFYPTAAPQGIGLATLTFGLLVMGAIAIGANHWLGQKRIEAATKEFVDQKSFTDFGNSYLEFEERAKSEVSALKAQITSLQGQIASQQTTVDSLKTVLLAASAEAEKSAAKNKKSKVVKKR